MADSTLDITQPLDSPRKPLEKALALYKAEAYKQESWERDKKIKRADNFKKAVAAREVQLEEIRAEKERKALIAEQRLENLQKARKALKRMRKKGEL